MGTLEYVKRRGKTAWLPKVRVEPVRRESYEAAVRARRDAGERDLTLTQWIRETLDREAEHPGEDD